MDEDVRIIEVTGYSKPVKIHWHKDPTAHLLKIPAVNAKSKRDDTQSAQPQTPPGDKGDDSVSAD